MPPFLARIVTLFLIVCLLAQVSEASMIRANAAHDFCGYAATSSGRFAEQAVVYPLVCSLSPILAVKLKYTLFQNLTVMRDPREDVRIEQERMYREALRAEAFWRRPLSPAEEAGSSQAVNALLRELMRDPFWAVDEFLTTRYTDVDAQRFLQSAQNYLNAHPDFPSPHIRSALPDIHAWMTYVASDVNPIWRYLRIVFRMSQLSSGATVDFVVLMGAHLRHPYNKNDYEDHVTYRWTAPVVTRAFRSEHKHQEEPIWSSRALLSAMNINNLFSMFPLLREVVWEDVIEPSLEHGLALSSRDGSDWVGYSGQRLGKLEVENVIDWNKKMKGRLTVREALVGDSLAARAYRQLNRLPKNVQHFRGFRILWLQWRAFIYAIQTPAYVQGRRDAFKHA